jgi:hypothetical protein
MGKRIIIFGASTALILLTSVLFLPRHQPTFQGVKLRDWLDSLDPLSGTSVTQKQTAEEAVRAIGKDGLPWLISWLQAKDGRFGKAFTQSMYAQLLPNGISRFWRPAPDHNWKALQAFKVLGKTAEPAIPQLLSMVTNSVEGTHHPMLALEALCNIGTEKAFDAVLSLSHRRPEKMFTEKWLSQMFIQRNPDLEPYARAHLRQH